MFSTLLLLVIFVNVISINCTLRYKSFSAFKVIPIFFCALFTLLLFDFIIEDWIFSCFYMKSGVNIFA